VSAEMDRTSQGYVLTTCDLDAIELDRRAFGLFRDRRPDLYGPLLSLDGATGS
jgi:N-carbamoylputrescine amidase